MKKEEEEGEAGSFPRPAAPGSLSRWCCRTAHALPRLQTPRKRFPGQGVQFSAREIHLKASTAALMLPRGIPGQDVLICRCWQWFRGQAGGRQAAPVADLRARGGKVNLFRIYSLSLQ